MNLVQTQSGTVSIKKTFNINNSSKYFLHVINEIIVRLYSDFNLNIHNHCNVKTEIIKVSEFITAHLQD